MVYVIVVDFSRKKRYNIFVTPWGQMFPHNLVKYFHLGIILDRIVPSFGLQKYPR